MVEIIGELGSTWPIPPSVIEVWYNTNNEKISLLSVTDNIYLYNIGLELLPGNFFH